MELDRALELSVVSSWEDLVGPNEVGSIRVEYRNIANLPLDLVEVWMIKKRGYGVLICRYCTDGRNQPGGGIGAPTLCFANSYRSKTLADNLAMIVKGQQQFSRPSEISIHGCVQIDPPNASARKSAAAWSLGIHGSKEQEA